MMTTAEGPAVPHEHEGDPKAAYGFAMILNSEDDHRRIGQHGSLLGYSGSLYDFSGKNQLTIVVLTNTEGQNAYAITRGAGRARCSGCRRCRAPQAEAAERVPGRINPPRGRVSLSQLAGTFVLKLEQVTDRGCTIRSYSTAGPIACSTRTAGS